jgi:hypothetical protein
MLIYFYLSQAQQMNSKKKIKNPRTASMRKAIAMYMKLKIYAGISLFWIAVFI